MEAVKDHGVSKLEFFLKETAFLSRMVFLLIYIANSLLELIKWQARKGNSVVFTPYIV